MNLPAPFHSFYRYLNAVAVFAEADFLESMAAFRLANVEKGMLWIEQGKVARELAFIRSGFLRSFHSDEKGNQITSCFCQPETLSTSFKSFITQRPSALSVQALERTELITIAYDDLQHLYKTIPVWQEVSRLLAEEEYLSLWSYAYSLNTETAKEKYLRLMADQPLVLEKASVQDIASYLGITRETLSRIRRQLFTNDSVTNVK
jgi:CRP-like cAMP-binding protein